MHMADRAKKKWTLEELDSFPDDGNKYELIRGQLFVTPAPTVSHETILARLTRILEPYGGRTIRAIRLGQDDVIADDTLPWHPAGAELPLVIDLADVFAPRRP